MSSEPAPQTAEKETWPFKTSRGPRSILHDAFAAGDYLTAVRQAPRETWQHWASLALIGRPHVAIDELSRFDGPDAAFHTAVARWIAGDDERALAGLDRLPSEHARRLAALIRRRPITVLAQWPWNRKGSGDLLTGVRDPAFRVMNVSFHPRDIQNRPYADARTIVPNGVTPDFYVAAMLEWHLIPPNVRDLGCPIIGHSSDFDLHIQAVAPWLALFDELVVLDEAEWRAMRGLVGVPVSVFPKVFGIPARLPGLTDELRPDDVFVSGTLIHPYHTDKDAMVLELLRLGHAGLRMVSGFEDVNSYYRSLAGVKICCCYIRHPGSMPTRGLEALAAGCAVAVQEESALRLFADETEGTVAYGGSSGRLSTQLERVLGSWDEHARRARRGAAKIREEFSLSRVSSEYLRFLTFLAARPRTPRTVLHTERLVQKRSVLEKGWLPTRKFGGELLTKWAAASVARIDAQLAEAESPRLLNDRARERLLAHYHDPVQPDPGWLPSVVEPLERAVGRFAGALVPRLNLIRIQLHYGGPAAVASGLMLLDETLNREPDAWLVDPLDDVLPWDFCPSLFDYRRYFDTVTATLGGAGGGTSELIAVIIAALQHYRAKSGVGLTPDRRIAHAAQAARLDPSFAEYGLFHCRLLLERGRPQDGAGVAAELRRLAGHSARVLEILDLARGLSPELRAGWFDEVAALADRFWNATTMREHFPEPTLRSLVVECRPMTSAPVSEVYS